MQLSKEQKQSLGIEFDGDDVPETEILKAAETFARKAAEVPADLAELQAKAAAGEKFIELQRAEVTRLAKLAELGSEDGELAPVIVKQLGAADFDTLVELEQFYEGKVGKKFPAGGRSSQENTAGVEDAGGAALAADVPEDGLFS